MPDGEKSRISLSGPFYAILTVGTFLKTISSHVNKDIKKLSKVAYKQKHMNLTLLQINGKTILKGENE